MNMGDKSKIQEICHSEPVDVSGQTLELIGVGEGESDKSTVELSTTSVSDKFSTPDTSQEIVDMVGSQEVLIMLILCQLQNDIK